MFKPDGLWFCVILIVFASVLNASHNQLKSEKLNSTMHREFVFSIFVYLQIMSGLTSGLGGGSETSPHVCKTGNANTLPHATYNLIPTCIYTSSLSTAVKTLKGTFLHICIPVEILMTCYLNFCSSCCVKYIFCGTTLCCNQQVPHWVWNREQTNCSELQIAENYSHLKQPCTHSYRRILHSKT